MNNTYNYAPGAVHLDLHHNNISMSASQLADLVRSFIAEDVEPIQETAQYKKEYCEYICREKLKEQGLYTLDEFEQMMANATKEPALQFAKFLVILNFMGHSKKQIFDNLRKHFPEMRDYDYPNFAAAY